MMKKLSLLILAFSLSCNTLPTSRCASTNVMRSFKNVNELLEVANTGQWASLEISIFVLNSIVVSRDSVDALIKTHHNHKIISVQNLIGATGNQLDGNPMRIIVIESCVE